MFCNNCSIHNYFLLSIIYVGNINIREQTTNKAIKNLIEYAS